VAIVRKRRRSYHLERNGWPITVCLDTVEQVGTYVEVEVVTPPESKDAARQMIAAFGAELGLTEVERRSYLQLYLNVQAASGLADPAHSLIVARTVAELRQALREARRGGKTVGLVPTMGALHSGHLRLIEAARAQNEFVVVSIFVNPTQFGPNEDLTRYPRPIQSDLEACQKALVDLVFHPEPAEVYPPGYRTYAEVTELQDVLEGASRPGHFRGVCTVVLKLFHLVQPNRAYFGQKDAQQARIIQQMVQDLNVPVELCVLPIVREPDGLALSSRNRYLDAEQRRYATVLFQALRAAGDRAQGGERDSAVLRQLLVDRIRATPGAVLDYAVVVDSKTLEPVHHVQGEVLLAVAVRFGTTRLIDNLLIPSR
jgi:pantoate--beta-alanine ligase